MRLLLIPILLWIILSFLFSSCQRVIGLQLQESEPRLVIEGLITDKLQQYCVKLSKTKDFFDTSASPTVDNALVIISDNMGGIDTLVPFGNGYYLSKTIKKAVPGVTYSLSVKTEGQLYVASSKMHQHVAIDSLAVKYDKTSNAFQTPGYYVYVVGKENPEPNSYYRWIQYQNGHELSKPVAYTMYSDMLLNGSPYIYLRLPYPYAKGDTVLVEQLSVSKEYYDYFMAVNSLIGKTGAPFDSPPANPVSNLSNGALGYFFAVAVSSKSIVIP